MKKQLSILLAVLLVAATSCKKAQELLYSDINRVQLSDTAALNTTFVYDAATVTRDTIYMQVNTIGGISANERPVTLLQVPEYDYSYVRDPVTNKTDTIKTEKPFKAVAGVHYVDFKDPSVQSLMVIKANQASSLIPIILLRDASLKTESYRLRFELQTNSSFGLGEKKAIGRTILFSDRLERFYSWRFDNGTAPAFYSFGKYSTAKHQFMIDVIKANIDEAWYQAAVATGALSHYINYLKDALVKFNNDPGNIASGKAPLRETSAASSPLVTF